MTCKTGAVTRQQAIDALTPLGWLPGESNQAFVSEKTDSVLEKLPPDVKAELLGTEPILIEVRTGVWGFCSLERQSVLNFRLFNENTETLQDVALTIVRRFPESFLAVNDGEVEFPEPIEIRKTDNEETLAHGTVQHRHTLGFRRYVREERRREYTAIRWLLSLFVVSVAASVALFFTTDSDGAIYLRGWFDRAGSAFTVALLTAVIGLLFEYREWRNKEEHIYWTFGTAKNSP